MGFQKIVQLPGFNNRWGGVVTGTTMLFHEEIIEYKKESTEAIMSKENMFS